MNISTHKTEYLILESGGQTVTHIRKSQPYQLHASTHALTGQAFFNKQEKIQLFKFNLANIHSALRQHKP